MMGPPFGPDGTKNKDKFLKQYQGESGYYNPREMNGKMKKITKPEYLWLKFFRLFLQQCRGLNCGFSDRQDMIHTHVNPVE